MYVIEDPIIIRSWVGGERKNYVLPVGTHTVCELSELLNDQAGYEAWEVTDDGALKGPYPNDFAAWGRRQGEKIAPPPDGGASS